LILAHILGIESFEVLRLTALNRLSLTVAQSNQYEQIVNKFESGIPLQHLLGTHNFAGVNLKVGPGVFVPRPETEMMLELIQPGPGDELLDLGAGSGAIGLAFWIRTPALKVTMVEKSARAFRYLKLNTEMVLAQTRNAETLRLKPQLIHADARLYLKDLSADSRFDWLTINPPYVPRSEKVGGPASHDPKMVLFSEDHGMKLIKDLLKLAYPYLEPNGVLLFEHHETQQDQLFTFAQQIGYRTALPFRDLNQRPRFIKLQV
jgi:release factor glutamine methyltransferase